VGGGGGGGVNVVVAVDVQANLEAGLKRWVETKIALGTLALGFSGLVEGCPCLLPVKNTGASWLISSHSCFDRSRGPRTSNPSHPLIAKVGSNLKHNGVVRTVLLDRKLASPYCAGTSQQFKPTDDATKGRCSHNRKV
jgi:hypothetical protein